MENHNALHKTFLQVVRLGIGTSNDAKVLDDVDWVQLKALADVQGLSAVVLDGLYNDNANVLHGSEGDTACDQRGANLDLNVPKVLLLQWIGEVMQNYEDHYGLYRRTIAELAGWYNAHGYKMMVLKGFACSINWPKPEHRPCGDIDIWLFGRQKEADGLLTSDMGINVDNSHHHHTVFNWQGFTVENHYDFINVYHHKSHVRLEKVLKELGMDDSHYLETEGTSIYLPSPNLHALFLLKHAALHFVGTELTFRQILDWAFFVKAYGREVDWEMIFEVLEEHGMMPMFNILNAICVEDLGIESTIFPVIHCDKTTKDKVLAEIFASSYQDDRGAGFFNRQTNRLRRWRANGWKHELCYKESRSSAFWAGVCGHLLKPKSI